MAIGDYLKADPNGLDAIKNNGQYDTNIVSIDINFEDLLKAYSGASLNSGQNYTSIAGGGTNQGNASTNAFSGVSLNDALVLSNYNMTPGINISSEDWYNRLSQNLALLHPDWNSAQISASITQGLSDWSAGYQKLLNSAVNIGSREEQFKFIQDHVDQFNAYRASKIDVVGDFAKQGIDYEAAIGTSASDGLSINDARVLSNTAAPPPNDATYGERPLTGYEKDLGYKIDIIDGISCITDKTGKLTQESIDKLQRNWEYLSNSVLTINSGDTILEINVGGYGVRIKNDLNKSDLYSAVHPKAAEAGAVLATFGPYLGAGGGIRGFATFPKAIQRSSKALELAAKDPTQLLATQAEREVAQIAAQKESQIASTRGWVDKEGTPYWPKKDGFVNTPVKIRFEKGTLFSRYGSTRGRYASPAGTTYEARALAPGTDNEMLWEVVKPFDGFGGETAPWFDQPGGGIQYQFNESVQWLKNNGYIKEYIER